MKVKVLFIAGAYLLSSSMLKAQDLSVEEELHSKVSALENSVRLLQKFKVSGYIQAQYQFAQMNADGNNFKLTNRANAYEQSEFKKGDMDWFGRFGLRRGRFKLTYEDGIASGVVQIDVTDKGISSDRNVVMFKDIYLQIKDPWFGTNILKAGIFDRTFGHEIAYSSSRRESPERSRIFQSLFPDERDLGIALTLQPAKSSPLNILKFEGGLFAGNGIKPQISSKMDFIGHLTVSKQVGDNTVISGGVSAYLGGMIQTDSAVFVMKDKKFISEKGKTGDNPGKFAKRQYFGVDLQISTLTSAGLTYVRGEFITGEHPGSATGAYDFKFNAFPAYPTNNNPMYMRKISGGYVILVQDLGRSPFSAVVKYDWYNPNRDVSGNDIAVAGSGTTTGDITRSVFGSGINWRINPALKLTAYYDIVRNETTENLKDTKDAKGIITSYGYEGSNRKSDVFTLRLQYKF